MNDYIRLNNLKLNHFTIQDAQFYCQILNINPDDIKRLDLQNNKLTDISGVNIFKNVESLSLQDNQIKNINSLKNLLKLEDLDIDNLKFTDEIQTVKILKNLPKLNVLDCKNTFKTLYIRNELAGIYIYD